MKAHCLFPERSRGVALIAVLWLVALLTLLATAVATLSVSHRRAAVRYGESVEMENLADSAIRLTLLHLLAPKTPQDALTVGAPIQLQLLGGTVDVSIALEQGRIDLNTADENLLFALFAANGWEEADARTLVAHIQDWKDVDDQTREHGAERSEYSAAGFAYVPRNGPFESVDELHQVLEASDVNIELLDSLTVYTHTPAPLTRFASEPVTRALKFADDHQLAGHRWLLDEASDAQASQGEPPPQAASLIGEVIRIRSCAQRKQYQRCRTLVARLTGSAQRPMQVFAWN